MRRPRCTSAMLAIPVLLQLGCAPIASEIRQQVEPQGALTVPVLVRIPGSSFVMGSPLADPSSVGFRAAEQPNGEVHVDEFWLGRSLVTAEEFCEFLNDVGNEGHLLEPADTSWAIEYNTIRVVDDPEPDAGRLDGRVSFAPQPGAARSPAQRVTWQGATAYCRWLSRKLGHRFRLPTEAEWELAARGPRLRRWPWGNDPPLLVDCSGPIRLRAWHWWGAQRGDFRLPDPNDGPVPADEGFGAVWVHGVASRNRDRWPRTPVCSFANNATPEGVYDMLGYCFGQWCSDRAEPAIARTPSIAEPTYVTRGMAEVVVGYDDPGVTPARVLRWALGDAGPEAERIAGRTWSRVGHNHLDGQMFRVASSSAVRYVAAR